MPTILVADDNSNIQKMVILALKDQGIDVVAVGNGEAAVRKLPEVSPDLILADIFMPVRNGYEVCEFVKQEPRFSHIPVILLVGAFDPLDEREAQRVGADGVLKKPFVPPDPLIALVKSVLAKAGVEHLAPVGVAAAPAASAARNASPAVEPRPPFTVPPSSQPPSEPSRRSPEETIDEESPLVFSEPQEPAVEIKPTYEPASFRDSVPNETSSWHSASVDDAAPKAPPWKSSESQSPSSPAMESPGFGSGFSGLGIDEPAEKTSPFARVTAQPSVSHLETQPVEPPGVSPFSSSSFTETPAPPRHEELEPEAAGIKWAELLSDDLLAHIRPTVQDAAAETIEQPAAIAPTESPAQVPEPVAPEPTAPSPSFTVHDEAPADSEPIPTALPSPAASAGRSDYATEGALVGSTDFVEEGPDEAQPAAAPAEPAQSAALSYEVPSQPNPEVVDAVVAKVLERMQPQILDLVTREILKPVVEALVRRELEKQ